MESDAKMQQYLLLAKSARGRALCELINKATAEPGLFAFGELLDTPSIAELRQGEHAPFVMLLELFCYGTWPDYADHQARLPPLNEQQQLKLKQLTIISLATEEKTLPYDRLMTVLGISSVRELEDFLIAHCFYSGALRGKLDQAARSLQVHQALSRDVRPERLPRLAAALDSWLATATGLLGLLDANMTAATVGTEAAKAHKAALDKRQDELRRNIKAELDLRGAHGQDLLLDEAFDGMDQDGGGYGGFIPPGPGAGGGGGAGRPKRVRGKRGWQEGAP
ncbi:COP9 signalosome complex subunit [Raphidocelis subcapitata]|uniref:COP9 signalosome complex subunit n=1 Tax=Raphidocelis subcapitata TaxID=307507 RepID=A0A2V0PIY8_9CHLO|nr:COP9 signalosome complex subunit [Raphidocelis subcapitata]|eukprot:GBF99519.1 COP9 signalosome complex subunit [Raphidocelis subcapitata]